MSKTILVTGSAGFISSHLVKKLLEQGHKIIGVDNFSNFYDVDIKFSNLREHFAQDDIQAVFESVESPLRDFQGVDLDSSLLKFTQSNLKSISAANYSFYGLDLCDYDSLRKVFSENKITHIVHLAALAGVRPSMQKPRLYWMNNTQSTVNLLDLASKHQVKKFVHASSSSVYGSRPCGPFKEDEDISKPISIYAATKVSDEALLKTYSSLFSMSCVVLRFFTVYGPGQRPDLAIHKFTKLIDEGKPIQVYGDGSAQRDFTYVDDTLDGVIKALDYETSYEVFNLGESHVTDVNTMIKHIENALGKKAIIEYTSPVPGDVPITYADISKAQRLLGYNPQTLLEDGIPKFVEWYKSSL